jgi:hypothetical protein
MSSSHFEQRSSRPFRGLFEIERFFDTLSLEINKGDEIEIRASDSTTELNENDFNDSSFILHLAEDDASFEKIMTEIIKSMKHIGLPVKDIEFSVSFRLNYLSIIEKSISMNLNELQKQKYTIPILSRGERHHLTESALQGFDIVVRLLLNEQQKQRKTLVPYFPGTILAETYFTILTDRGNSNFSIEPLNAQRRKVLGNLSTNTITFIDFGGVNPIDPGSDEQDITLYVDEKVLTAVNENSKSAGGLFVQRKLALEVANAIVMHAHKSLNQDNSTNGFSEIDGSIIGKYLKPFATNDNGRVNKTIFNDLVEEVKTNPEIIKARIESLLSEGTKYSLQQNLLDLVVEEE